MAVESSSGEYARALAENVRYAAEFDRSKLPSSPRRKLAVLACMDGRLAVDDALGLRIGDAHVIRNAGGLASEDAIRSLVVSRQLLGIEEVIVIGHTGCGMLTFADDAARRDIAQRTGVDLELPLGAFSDLEQSIREQVDRIRAHPWLGGVPVHGLVFAVETGRLREIS